jgi:hypothetical protein
MTSIFRKRLLPLAFLFTGCFTSLISNPGDTTWVTVMNKRTLDHYGNYDTTATFPTGLRYRKIRLHYILDRYACPGNPQYCGSWDYTTELYILPAGADTVEIARIITPYATDWLTKGIKHDYIVEVTDYAHLLTAQKSFRFRYEGYSWGFNVTVKFEMIEGIPPMDPIEVKKIYNGYFTYGNSNNPIENYLVPKTFTYAANSPRVFMKNLVSGHGSDNTGCGEFCKKYYQLKLNGSMISQNTLWRADCGVNEVYPQTGTWVFERANWCPGAVVWPIYHDLSALTSPNTNFTVDVDMQPYTIANATGGFNWHSQLIKYSAPNHTVDVSVEDIISPTKDDNYYRENPICSNPTIRIKNTGTDIVNQVVFTYSIQGLSARSYTWTGALSFLEEEVVILPLTAFRTMALNDRNFYVKILSVNGAADQNAFNDIYSSVSRPVLKTPNDFVITTYCNKSINPNTGKSETSWMLLNENGATVAQRDTMTINFLYSDTLHLNYGCYELVIDDYGCDGYNWWLYSNAQAYPVNPGPGTVRFDYINQNSSIKVFQGDFGCQQIYKFRIDSLPPPPPPPDDTGLDQFGNEKIGMEIFPSPGDQMVYVRVMTGKPEDVRITITSMTGQLISVRELRDVRDVIETLETNSFAPGIYLVNLQVEGHASTTGKMIIRR